MSILAKMDDVIGVMIITCTGVVTPSEAADAKKELAMAALRTEMALVDLREARLRMTPNDLMHLATSAPLFSRVVIVAPDDLSFALARTFELHSGDSRTVSVFRDYHDALVWLAGKDGRAPGARRAAT